MSENPQTNTAVIKHKSIVGVAWKFSERIAARLVSMVVSVILARLLTPDDYSVVGIVSIFFVFAEVFISGGFTTALIQKKDADIKDYSSVLFFSIIVAVLMYFILFFTAPFIAKVYDKEILVAVIRIMSLTLIINAIKAVICAKISSELKFKQYFLSTISGVIVSAVIGIVMAYNGFGPWSLVAQQMVNSIIGTIVILFVSRFKIEFKIYFDRLRGLLSFGGKIFISNVISTIYSEIKPLVIGLKYSGADLSFYSKGNSFPSILNTTLGDTFSAVYFPTMAKFQDNKENMLNGIRRFMQLSSFLVFPAMIGFFVVSDNFVSVLLTDKWMPASIYIKIASISYMFNIIQRGNLQAIQASGRSDLILKLEIIKKTTFFFVIALFLFFTDSPVLLAISGIVNALFASIVNSFPNRKILDYGYRKQIIDLLPNLILSIIMGIVVYFVGFLPINKLLLLILQILTGCIIYVILNLAVKNKNLFYFINILKDVFLKHRGKV